MSCVPSASIWKEPSRELLSGDVADVAAVADEVVLVGVSVGSAETGAMSLMRMLARKKEVREMSRGRLRHLEVRVVQLEPWSSMPGFYLVSRGFDKHQVVLPALQ